MVHGSLYYERSMGDTVSRICVRRGTTFDPVLSVKEVGHVKHMHAVSLLIHPNFSPNFMVTCLDLFENSLLIRFQTDRKFTFDPVRTNGAGSKVSFRSVYQSCDH